MITPDEQNSFDERFIRYIKKYTPEWEQYLKKETYKGEEYLSVNIPSNEGIFDGIRIKSHGCEYTVYFGGFHCHFSMFADEPEEEEFVAAVDYIKAVMGEKIVLIDYYDKNNKLTSSNAKSPNSPIRKVKGQQMVVRSWKGTYNEKNINKKLHWAIRLVTALTGIFFLVVSQFCFVFRDVNNYYFPQQHRPLNYFEFFAYILVGIYAIIVAIRGRFIFWRKR